MNQTVTILYKVSKYHKERIVFLLGLTILAIVSSYIFLLQRTIINVVQREKISHEMALVSADVSGLEEKYFAIKNTITPELAHSKGLKDPENISYISRKSLTAMVSHHEL